NAIKFTMKGSVCLAIEVTTIDAKTQGVKFSVSDTGVGIPIGKQLLIFDSFSQASSSTTRNFGGTGLGLSITKELLELMDSQIHLKSKPNVGSVFSFVIEFTLGQKLTNLNPQTGFSYESSDLKKCHILLAEDNVFNQKIAVKILEKFNAQVTTVSNGKLAMEALKKHHFDLLLLDLNMPVMDGWSVLDEINRNTILTTKDLPIIALTAEVTPKSIQRLQAMNIPHISKPFQPEQLYQTIVSTIF
ncbi:MAG: response regulator, partial [Bacteroidota bacterium]